MPTTKEFKTIDEQISGLKLRELKFKNEDKARLILKKHNYFDIINGFETILLTETTPKKLYTNVYFEDFYDLYLLDMRLNQLFLGKIFLVEHNLKTSISYNFSSINCLTRKDILNYTDPNYFRNPRPKDVNLSKIFKTFDMFKKATFDTATCTYKKDSFLDIQKSKKAYIKNYDEPPFWVIIKNLSFGSLYYLYIFLKDDVRNLVLTDFNFSHSEHHIFEQIIYILKEVRNDCAHLELITRFKIVRNNKGKIKNLNNLSDVVNKFSLSKSNICCMDVIKILKHFYSIREFKFTIVKFYITMTLKGRKDIAIKILGKMGSKNIMDWIKL